MELYYVILIFVLIVLIGTLVHLVSSRKTKERKERDEWLLDLAIPDILPMYRSKNVKRGKQISGTEVIFTWSYKGNSRTRSYPVTQFKSEHEFRKEWYHQELQFYFANSSHFVKRRKAAVSDEVVALESRVAVLEQKK